MVNVGASKGCSTCKQRKVKCDEDQPSCKRCVKLGVRCPGYDIFRDLTHDVSKKTIRSYHRKQYKEVIDLGFLKYQHGYKQIRPVISEDPEQKALCFLLSHFLPCVPGYFIDDLPMAYSNANSGSVLSIATLAVSLGFTSLNPQSNHLKPLALAKYGHALRLVRKHLEDPKLIASDELIMSILLLRMFEHYRLLASEPCSCRYHTRGVVALIVQREGSSFTSEISLRLLKQARAEMIYHALTISDSTLLREHLIQIDQHLPRENISSHDNAANLFYELADLAADDCAVLEQSRTLLTNSGCPPQCADLEDLLHDAQKRDEIGASWIFAPPRPWCKSFDVDISGCDVADCFYPSRVLYYDNAPQAASYISWRICRIRILDIVSRTCQLLMTQFGKGLAKEKREADEAITGLVEDICSSIPFYVGWTGPLARLSKFLNTSEAPDFSNVAVMANWSQLLPVIWAAWSLPCISSSRRQWLHDYLLCFTSESKAKFRMMAWEDKWCENDLFNK